MPPVIRMPAEESLTDAMARYFGEGLGRGATERLEEERDLGRTMRGFKRLAPVRRAARAEEIGGKYGPEAAGQVEAGTFPGEVPYAATAKRTEERRKSGATLDVMGPTLRELGVLPPEGPLPESYYEAPPEALHWLLSERVKMTKPRDRARTMTELREIAQQKNHPEYGHANNVINAYNQEQVDRYKKQIKALGEQPPDISAAERERLAGAENIQGMAKDIRAKFKAGGSRFVGPWAGGETAAELRRLTPWFKPSLQEEQMREVVNRLANYIIRLEAGLTQSQKEEIRQFRVVPMMGTTPEKFIAGMEGSVKYAQRIENMLKGELAKPRRIQPPPFPGWTQVEE